MQKSSKILLGAVTLWPIIYMFIFFIFIFSTILFRFEPGAGGGLPPTMAVIFGLHILTMLLIMGLTVFYIVDVFRSNRVDKARRLCGPS